jgi:hypothetical protein
MLPSVFQRGLGRDFGPYGRNAELKCLKHVGKVGAALEKYQSCMKTAPARGSAEAANPTEGGYIWWGNQSSDGRNLR